jgi:hypothetical protein
MSVVGRLSLSRSRFEELQVKTCGGEENVILEFVDGKDFTDYCVAVFDGEIGAIREE